MLDVHNNMTKGELPVYELIIDEEAEKSGVLAIAMVDRPAIMTTWQKFTEEKGEQKPMKFTADKERRIITGAAMIPNLPIERYSEQFGKHFVYFTKETIEKIAMKFMRTQSMTSINLMHDNTQKPVDVFFFESFIVDSSRGIKSPDGKEFEDGTWIVSAKVDNEQVWSEIDKYTGWSVEGLFNMIYADDKKEKDIVKEIESILKTNDMNFSTKIKLNQVSQSFGLTLFTFGEVKLETGETLAYDGEELVVGMPLMIKTPEGMLPAPDGKHMTVDGLTIVIDGGQGVVSEVIPAEAKPEEVQPQAQSENTEVSAPAEERIAKRDVERIIQERERIFSEELATEVEKAKTEVTAQFSAKISEKESEIEKLTKELNELKGQPAAEPTVKKFGIEKKGKLNVSAIIGA